MLCTLVSQVFDIELASLVRVLELDVLLMELIFTLVLLYDPSNIQLAAHELDSIDFRCSIKGLDCTLRTVVSILKVFLVSRFVLDNSKGALRVRVKSEVADVSKLLKKLPNFIFTPVRWEILGIDVVEELFLCAFSPGLVPAGLALLLSTSSLDSFPG